MIDYHEKETIERHISLPHAATSLSALTSQELLDLFQIQSTASLVLALCQEKQPLDTSIQFSVALQFPDSLLSYAPAVVELLRLLIHTPLLKYSQSDHQIDLVVLADTTFGSCCVDSVAAEHARSDLILHYGPSCLSRPTSDFPVVLILETNPIEVEETVAYFLSQFESDFQQPVLVLYDVAYHHAEVALKLALSSAGFTNLIWPHVQTAYNMPAFTKSGFDCKHLSSTLPSLQDSSIVIREAQGRQYSLPPGLKLEDISMFYVGGESLTLTNIMMTHSVCKQVVVYDPVLKSGNLQSGPVNKLLMRRYFMVQKAKDADVVGIVVGTIGLASYLPVIENLKRLVLASGKKPYMLALGKPSPAKLGNFLEIDVFVLVACPQNALLDTRDFHRPIVTPFELCIALDSAAEWDVSNYRLDLITVDQHLSLTVKNVAEKELQRASRRAARAGSDSDSEDDEPHFSLVTGAYKQRRKYVSIVAANDLDASATASEEGVGALVSRNQASTVSKYISTSAAAEYLNEKRTFRGLATLIGETDISDVQEGRRGIARGYANPDSGHSLPGVTKLDKESQIVIFHHRLHPLASVAGSVRMRSTDSDRSVRATWLRGGVLNGEADLDQLLVGRRLWSMNLWGRGMIIGRWQQRVS
ncbi:hypothetical protein BASA61_009740 [Batrachochytrium salamandrivorans]|nr:hypothetical protein BASA61_009740 [Batrachochytrium salamandrivorans]KAH9266537.1 diphthamide biosynthesis protein 2 [Batrachochytrium salamandrivorans]